MEEQEQKERYRHHQTLYQKNLAERAEKNYHFNYKLCQGIVLQMLDFTTKLAQYRELTQK